MRQPQPRHHGTWRRTRKRQPRLAVLTSHLRFPLAACFKSTPSSFFLQEGGDTVLLVRGLQENTMVAHCGSGWTARDLSASLRCRTSVPVHLFYLVVEGRVIDGDELVRSLARDRVVSMRGRVLGGSRNVSPVPGEWTCSGCMRSGCWPTKNTCFRCGTVRPSSPLPPGTVLPNSRPARAPREQRHPGRVPGNSASGCPTELRTPSPHASSAPSPPSVPATGGLNLDLVVQFLRGGSPECGSCSCSQKDSSATH